VPAAEGGAHCYFIFISLAVGYEEAYFHSQTLERNRTLRYKTDKP